MKTQKHQAEQRRIQDLKLGGREMWSGRSSAEGADGVESGEGMCPFLEKFWHVLLQNGAL